VPTDGAHPNNTYIIEVSIRNQVGNGKISFRRPNGTWVSTPTLGDGVHQSDVFTGAIAEIHVGADGDDTYEADYDYISLKKAIPLEAITHNGIPVTYNGGVITMAELFNILTYDHDIAENIDITTTDPDWTDVLSVTTPDRETGLYQALFSLKCTLNSTSQSFLYRFSLDGGSTWGPVYEKEVKDRHNTEVIEVLKLYDQTTTSPIQIAVQCTREGTANCEVLEAFISIERVG
jgi:hypothetical protein